MGWRRAVEFVADFGLHAFAVFAASVARRRPVRRGGSNGLGCLTVGVAGWAGGAALWIYYEKCPPAAFPVARGRQISVVSHRRGLAMDVVSGWIFGSVADPIHAGRVDRRRGAVRDFVGIRVTRCLRGREGTSGFALALSIAYPASDIAILTVAVLVLARARTRTAHDPGDADRRESSCMALSDSAFAYLTAQDSVLSGHFIDIGWAAAFLTFGMAALDQSPGPAMTEVVMPQVPSRVSLWLPYVPFCSLRGVYSEVPVHTWAGADLRIVDPSDERGDGAAVRRGPAEPAVAEDGGRPGIARHLSPGLRTGICSTTG